MPYKWDYSSFYQKKIGTKKLVHHDEAMLLRLRSVQMHATQNYKH